MSCRRCFTAYAQVFHKGGLMQWAIWSTFFCAGAAVWCGLAWRSSARALAAVQSAALPVGLDPKSERRLQDCESLLSEVVAALSRIEARDKMRRVRAGKTLTEDSASASSVATNDASEPSPPKSRGPTLSSLPTSEIRRRLATRQPIT